MTTRRKRRRRKKHFVLLKANRAHQHNKNLAVQRRNSKSNFGKIKKPLVIGAFLFQ